MRDQEYFFLKSAPSPIMLNEPKKPYSRRNRVFWVIRDTAPVSGLQRIFDQRSTPQSLGLHLLDIGVDANPISACCWSCVYPIRLFGQDYFQRGGEDFDTGFDNAFCFCKSQLVRDAGYHAPDARWNLSERK